jgi:hypothetical protein
MAGMMVCAAVGFFGTASASARAATDATPPSLRLSGGLVNERDQYFAADGIGVDVRADDPSGITRIGFTEVGKGEVDAKSACSHGSCPTSFSSSLGTYGVLSEGTHTFQVTATDAAGNVASSAAMSVVIDRTPPHASPGGVVAVFDPSDNSVDVSWSDATDPPLPDGTPGAVGGYTVYYGIGSGPYGYPIDTDGPSLTIPDQVEDEVVNMWVVTVDAAGNKSLRREDPYATEFMTGSDTATRTTMTPDNLGAEDDGESGDASIPDVDTSDQDPPELVQASALAAATRFPDLCTAEADPCGKYNGMAAAHYAHYHFDHYNRNYPKFGDDCTNFISQALKAGGMHYLRTDTDRVDDTTNADPTGPPDFTRHYQHGEGSWWAANAYSYRSPGPYPDVFDWTRSWSIAADSHDHLLEYGLARVVHGSDGLRAGDLLYYAWKDPNNEEWDHAAIVTKVTKTSVWVAQHGHDYERTLVYVLTHDGGVKDTHPDYRIEFLRPIHTAANVPY